MTNEKLSRLHNGKVKVDVIPFSPLIDIADMEQTTRTVDPIGIYQRTFQDWKHPKWGKKMLWFYYPVSFVFQ